MIQHLNNMYLCNSWFIYTLGVKEKWDKIGRGCVASAIWAAIWWQVNSCFFFTNWEFSPENKVKDKSTISSVGLNPGLKIGIPQNSKYVLNQWQHKFISRGQTQFLEFGSLKLKFLLSRARKKWKSYFCRIFAKKKSFM